MNDRDWCYPNKGSYIQKLSLLMNAGLDWNEHAVIQCSHILYFRFSIHSVERSASHLLTNMLMRQYTRSHNSEGEKNLNRKLEKAIKSQRRMYAAWVFLLELWNSLWTETFKCAIIYIIKIIFHCFMFLWYTNLI